MLKRFRQSYIRCATCPDRDVFAYEFAKQKEAEVVR